MISITLDSVDINSGNFRVKEIQHDSSAPIDLNMMELTREDGAKLISSNHNVKEITISGVCKGSSISDFETNLDTLKSYFNKQGVSLDIEYAGSTRRYVVYLKSFTTSRAYYNVTFCNYEAQLVVAKGIGEDTALSETLSAIALTDSYTFFEDINFGGTAEPKPQIAYVIDTAGSLTNIIFRNDTTGTQLAIATAWANGDRVLIDTADKTVQKNSTPVDFDGVFPKFVIGNNDIISQFEGTDVDVSQQSSSSYSANFNGSAQSFKPASTTTFPKISLILASDGVATEATVRIETDNAGKPSGTLVNANAIKTVSGLTGTTPTWVDFIFPAAISLTSGTTYHIVCYRSPGGFNAMKWFYDSSNPYSNGNACEVDKGAWATQTYDFTFKLYKTFAPNWSIDEQITYTKRYL